MDLIKTIHIHMVYFVDTEMVCHELTGRIYKHKNLKLHDIYRLQIPFLV